jgi:hypothetical protein
MNDSRARGRWIAALIMAALAPIPAPAEAT